MKYIMGIAFILIIGLFHISNSFACHRTPANQPTCIDMEVDKDGNIHVVYIDYAPNNVFYIRSNDRGITWSSPVSIHVSNKEAKRPRIAVAKTGVIHVIWVETGKRNGRVLVNSSVDGGATWSTPVRIALTNGSTDVSTFGKSKVYAIWKSDNPPDIFFKRSNDMGMTWNRKVNLSNSPGLEEHPVVTVSQTGKIYAVWEEEGPVGVVPPGTYYVYFSLSADYGRTWSPPQHLCGSVGDFLRPQIHIDNGGHIHMVWSDNRLGVKRETFYCVSADEGTTWSSPVNVSGTAGDSLRGYVTTDSFGKVYVTWEDTTNVPKEDIFFSSSNDGGATWSNRMNISNSVIRSYRAPIGTDGMDNMYVVYEEVKKDSFSGKRMSNIFFTRSLDGGITWSQSVSLFDWRLP